MDEKQIAITEAAIRVICRYGVKRTTMQDIADEAGVVRQTLYNYYKKKDDVLRATVTFVAAQAREAIESEWACCSSLAERLDVYFEHTVLQPHRVAHASPDADDIISGFNAAARTELEKEARRNAALLEQALAPYRAEIERAGLTVGRLADAVHAAAYGFKKHSNDLARLQDRLVALKTLVLTLVAPR